METVCSPSSFYALGWIEYLEYCLQLWVQGSGPLLWRKYAEYLNYGTDTKLSICSLVMITQGASIKKHPY